MFSKYLTLIITAMTIGSTSAHEPTIVKLTPPLVSQETISQEIFCDRPMREGKFNISLDQQNGKTIVHCYGHGGSGWTTLFGSVNKAIQLFLETNPDKSSPIHVIGSGCMGLTTAAELSRLGYTVEKISTRSIYDNPSWRAAGFFALVSVKTSPEEQENLNNIGLDTFLTYQSINTGEHPYISKDAVRYLPVYCSSQTDAGVENLELAGLIPPREYVTIDFGNGTVHPEYVKYLTFFLDTTRLMRELTDEVNRLNIPIEIREINSFDDLPETIIFNCSGLGARDLNHDNAVIPVRGHLLTLNELSGSEHMDYMIYTKVKQDENDEYIYLFPKGISITPDKTSGIHCFGVLGGTFLPNMDHLSSDEQEAINQKEFNKLLERTQKFFQG